MKTIYETLMANGVVIPTAQRSGDAAVVPLAPLAAPYHPHTPIGDGRKLTRDDLARLLQRKPL